MNVKRILALNLVLATVLVSIVVSPPPAAASPRIDVGISVNAPPPPLRREVIVVRPSARHIWVPGYWDWAPARHQYIWIGGRWVRPHHRHAVWVTPRWERRGNGTFFIRGHWRY
jgi:hypothetical protein